MDFRLNYPRIDEDDSFLPNQVSGLTLWLEYDYGVYTDTALTTPAVVTNTVKGWKNRATDAYHATEATNPPTLATDGLTFDGTNDVLRIARMTGAFSAGFSYFVVASLVDGRPPSATTPFGSRSTAPLRRLFYLQDATNGTLQGLMSENGTSVTATTLVTLADGQSPFFIAGFTAEPGGNITSYYNGTAKAPVSIAALTWANIATANTEAPFLGCISDGGTPASFCACTIQAVLIWNRVLTTAELLVVHRYLGAKYGITVP